MAANSKSDGAVVRENVGDYPNAEFWKGIGFSCAWQLSSSGLKHAIQFMLGMLQPLAPVCRINLACTSLGSKRFVVPLYDTRERGGMEFTRISCEKTPFSVISEETMDQPTIINDLAPYKIEVLKIDPSVDNLPFFQHASLLRLPLFKKNNLCFWISFWSDQTNAFNTQDIERYCDLIHPCLEGMKNVLISESSPDMLIQPSTENFLPLSALSGMAAIYKQVKQVAPTNVTVLISGESGVGKEMLAETIYTHSRRDKAPFVRVNCGAITSSLFTSELFGYEKGAYTGASSTRVGYFEFASQGTIFLDEIGELPLQAQVMLLRVLDKKIIQRVGSPCNIPVDVRVIAATNRDLAEMVKRGRFREDLYYRLTTYPIHIPPLRRRREDILPLARSILNIKALEYKLSEAPKLAKGEEDKLLAYDWPGNVRELVNVLERALINLTPTARMLQVDLPVKEKSSENPASGCWPTLEELEKAHIAKTLAKTNGRLGGTDGAAALLGIHYTTLHAKLKKFGLQRN